MTSIGCTTRNSSHIVSSMNALFACLQVREKAERDRAERERSDREKAERRVKEREQRAAALKAEQLQADHEKHKAKDSFAQVQQGQFQTG